MLLSFHLISGCEAILTANLHFIFSCFDPARDIGCPHLFFSFFRASFHAFHPIFFFNFCRVCVFVRVIHEGNFTVLVAIWVLAATFFRLSFGIWVTVFVFFVIFFGDGLLITLRVFFSFLFFIFFLYFRCVCMMRRSTLLYVDRIILPCSCDSVHVTSCLYLVNDAQAARIRLLISVVSCCSNVIVCPRRFAHPFTGNTSFLLFDPWLLRIFV